MKLFSYFSKLWVVVLSVLVAVTAIAADNPTKDRPGAGADRALTLQEKQAEFDSWFAKAQPLIEARSAQINQILAKFDAELSQLPNAEVQRRDLLQTLHRVDDAALKRAVNFASLEALQEFLSQRIAQTAANPQSADGQVQPRAALGDNINLVFTPITPCRIADSRNSTAGKLGANSTRTYYNYAASGQGGTEGCNDYYSPGMHVYTAGALALTVTVTEPAGTGHLTLRPYGSAGTSSVINYTLNQTIANSTVVKTTGVLGLPDFEIYTFASTHVVLDLLGFYLPSEPAALDCIQTADVTGSLGPTGYYRLDAPSCPSGYQVVSGTCGTDTSARVYLTDDRTISALNVYYCIWYADNASTTGRVSANCCRVPGTSAARF